MTSRRILICFDMFCYEFDTFITGGFVTARVRLYGIEHVFPIAKSRNGASTSKITNENKHKGTSDSYV